MEFEFGEKLQFDFGLIKDQKWSNEVRYYFPMVKYSPILQMIKDHIWFPKNVCIFQGRLKFEDFAKMNLQAVDKKALYEHIKFIVKKAKQLANIISYKRMQEDF